MKSGKRTHCFLFMVINENVIRRRRRFGNILCSICAMSATYLIDVQHVVG